MEVKNFPEEVGKSIGAGSMLDQDREHPREKWVLNLEYALLTEPFLATTNVFFIMIFDDYRITSKRKK